MENAVPTSPTEQRTPHVERGEQREKLYQRMEKAITIAQGIRSRIESLKPATSRDVVHQDLEDLQKNVGQQFREEDRELFRSILKLRVAQEKLREQLVQLIGFPYATDEYFEKIDHLVRIVEGSIDESDSNELAQAKQFESIHEEMERLESNADAIYMTSTPETFQAILTMETVHDLCVDLKKKHALVRHLEQSGL
jgi:hypothetical protein